MKHDTTSDWEYQVYIHGELVDKTPLKGIAWLKFESAKLIGLSELREVYIGEHFDPVIHTTIVHRGGVMPPCEANGVNCTYRKSIQNEYYSTARPTAFRTETICPGDRCGYMLKPSKIGGCFFDYDYCIRNEVR